MATATLFQSATLHHAVAVSGVIRLDINSVMADNSLTGGQGVLKQFGAAHVLKFEVLKRIRKLQKVIKCRQSSHNAL